MNYWNLDLNPKWIPFLWWHFNRRNSKNSVLLSETMISNSGFCMSLGGKTNQHVTAALKLCTHIKSWCETHAAIGSELIFTPKANVNVFLVSCICTWKDSKCRNWKNVHWMQRSFLCWRYSRTRPSSMTYFFLCVFWMHQFCNFLMHVNVGTRSEENYASSKE